MSREGGVVLGIRSWTARWAAGAMLVTAARAAPVAGQATPPPTRLHLVPTTEFPAPWRASIDFGQTTTFGGGTADGGPGSGNQTYHGWIEIGLPGRLALLGILEQNDDPTWGRPGGIRYEKEIFAIGGGVRWLAGTWREVRLAVEATLASLQLKSDPGLFTTEPGLERTHHVSASATLSAGIPLAGSWALTPSAGVILLPDSVGGLRFFGWTGVLGMGVEGQLAARMRAFAAGEVLLGPGTNRVDGDLRYRRAPVATAGAVYQASPRVQVTGYLTNVAGGTPGTRLLTLVGGAPLQWGARVRFDPTAPERDRVPGGGAAEGDGAAVEGGVGVPAAGTLPPLGLELRTTTDGERSRSARLRFGLSNESELELGVVRTPGLDAEPALGIRLGDRIHYRMGGKLQLAAEAWGDPATVGARVSVGRDGGTHQGYLVAELPVRRRMTSWATLTVAPATLQTGGESLVAAGLSAVLGRPGDVQLVLEPTLHLAGGSGDARRSPWTVALRSPAWRGLRAEAFATTALAVMGVGRFMGRGGRPTLGFGGSWRPGL